MAVKTVLITGNTFPVKDAIKALGGRWNPAAKGWDVPEDKANEAKLLVAGTAPATKPAARPARPSNWRPCGYPGCNPTYCDECDGKGADFRRNSYGY
jgi:hypothetical protein